MTSVDFDPFAEGYSVLQATEVNRRLRNSPVNFSTCHGGFWPMSRHADVLEAFRHDGRELSARHETLTDGTELGGTVLPPMTSHLGLMEQDPPLHTLARRALNPWFSRREMAARRARIDGVAGVLLDRRIASGRVEMLDDLIRPLAGIVTLELLGLPLDGLARLAYPVHNASHDLTEVDGLRAVWTRLKADIAAELDAWRGARRDDLVDALLRLEVDGRPVSKEFVIDTVFILLLGGVETVTGAFAGAMQHLDGHPDHRRQLLERPELLPTAFDEYLRYVTPATQNARTSLEDFELAGSPVRRGDRVFLNLYSANHDEDVFPAPEEVVLDRSPNRHMALGVGPHRCIGEHLAREMWMSMMSEVLSRIPDFQLLREDVKPIEQVGLNNGFVAMPATFTPGRPLARDESVRNDVARALASLER
jgi:cytochrome P450